MRSARSKLLVSTLAALALLLTGCGPVNSLNSLCTPDDNIFDADLVGTWQPLHPAPDSDEKDARWVFEREGDTNKYRLCLTSVEAKGCLKATARLAKIGDALFADFEGDVSETDGTPGSAFPIISTHMFGRIWIDKNILRLSLLSEDWAKKQLKANNLKLASALADSDLVVTATTPELRQFAQEHKEDMDAFSEKFEFQRAK